MTTYAFILLAVAMACYLVYRWETLPDHTFNDDHRDPEGGVPRAPLTPEVAFRMLLRSAALRLRPFTKDDWDAFAGCESNCPQIAEMGDYTIVVDGDTFLIITSEDVTTGGQLFRVTL